MKIQRMKTNRIVNPLGFDLKTPHVSWTVTDTEAKKAALGAWRFLKRRILPTLSLIPARAKPRRPSVYR